MLAPRSSIQKGPRLPRIALAIAGRSTPVTGVSTRRDSAMSGAVLPADTTASTVPCAVQFQRSPQRRVGLAPQRDPQPVGGFNFFAGVDDRGFRADRCVRPDAGLITDQYERHFVGIDRKRRGKLSWPGRHHRPSHPPRPAVRSPLARLSRPPVRTPGGAAHPGAG